MAPLSKSGKIDIVNIGLLVFSCALAFIVPFELFLFVYAILGPLHYLTEISWLHDKNYYVNDKRDIILLVVLSLLITLLSLGAFQNAEFIDLIFDPEGEGNGVGRRFFGSYLTYLGLASALFMVFIKKPILKFIGIAITFLLVVISNEFWVFFLVFLPTLVHVFLFTSLFMLFGALKSRSNLGLLAVILHIACPFVLFSLFPGESFVGLTDYGKAAYQESAFQGLNYEVITRFFDMQAFQGMSFEQVLYETNTGVAVMRFIAFAYTYHYLNWFSKTEIIRWHKVPKSRFAVVLVGWVVSIVLYAWDYTLGFKWLFLLSFMHVMLEFPLNYVSVIGIFKELKLRIVKPSS